MSEGCSTPARKAHDHLTLLSLQSRSSVRCLLRFQGAFYRAEVVEKRRNNEKKEKAQARISSLRTVISQLLGGFMHECK